MKKVPIDGTIVLDPRTSRRRIAQVLGVVVLTGCAVLWILHSTKEHARRRSAEFQQAVAEIAAVELSEGVYPDLKLPASIAKLAVSGLVNVVVEPDGRVIVLFKQSIGWKGNYQGVVCSSAPFRDADFSPDGLGRTILNTPAIESSPPVVIEKVGDQELRVMFDLG